MKEMGPVRLAFTYIGCFLGAGFVSGQELWQFFGAFGVWGYVGFLLAAVNLITHRARQKRSEKEAAKA